MAERDTRFGGNLETANIRPREHNYRAEPYQPNWNREITPPIAEPYQPNWNREPTQPFPLGQDNRGVMGAMADNSLTNNIRNKYKQFTEKFGDFDIGRGGIEYEKDFDIPFGGTGTFEGYGGDNDYGAGINFSWPLGQSAALDRGIGSTDEYQMAELTQDQIDHMRASDPIKTNLTKQELFQQIKDMEDKGSKGFLGFGARDPQEPTTWDEFNQQYKWLEGGGSPYGSEPHTKSYWTT